MKPQICKKQILKNGKYNVGKKLIQSDKFGFIDKSIYELRQRNVDSFKTILVVISLLMSRVISKPDFCICENKGADQLRG